MIDKSLAQFICDEGTETHYFLKIVSLCVLQNSSEIVLEVNASEKELLQMYESSDLLKLNFEGKNARVILKENGNWIFNIINCSKNPSRDSEIYICKDLKELSEILPKDVEWALNPGKYIKNFNRLFKKFGRQQIFDLAKFASEKENINLNMFLTEKVFNSLGEEIKFKRSKRVEDRVEIADYSEEQPY